MDDGNGIPPWEWQSYNFHNTPAFYIPYSLDDHDNNNNNVNHVIPISTTISFNQFNNSLLNEVLQPDNPVQNSPSQNVASSTQSQNAASSTQRRSNKRDTWTQDEHSLFLEGLDKYGKGKWTNISRNVVRTKTPTQVASHAQKYFIKLSRKKSIK